MAITRIPSPTSAPIQLSDELRLVRYLPFPRLLSLLNGQLSFTPLRLLTRGNDPLESRPISSPLAIVSELTTLDAAAVKELARASPDWIRAKLDRIDTPALERSNLLASVFHEFINQRRAVSCWFTEVFESAAMWASFAHQGIAVQTDLGSLENVLPKNLDFVVSAVRYRDRSTFMIGPGNAEHYPHMILRPFLLKGREFSHEREVRIITRCRPDQEWFAVPTPDFMKCIRQIIISPYIDPVSAFALKQHIETLLEPKFEAAQAPPVSFSSISEPSVEEADSRATLDRLYQEYMPADDRLPL